MKINTRDNKRLLKEPHRPYRFRFFKLHSNRQMVRKAGGSSATIRLEKD